MAGCVGDGQRPGGRGKWPSERKGEGREGAPDDCGKEGWRTHTRGTSHGGNGGTPAHVRRARGHGLGTSGWGGGRQ